MHNVPMPGSARGACVHLVRLAVFTNSTHSSCSNTEFVTKLSLDTQKQISFYYVRLFLSQMCGVQTWRITMMKWFGLVMVMCCMVVTASRCQAGAEANRLTYLDEFSDPYQFDQSSPKLVTPQWIGEAGVEVAVVLSIDDMSDWGTYESYLRPLLERLKSTGEHHVQSS